MIIKELNQRVRTALEGIKGRNLAHWYKELNELLEEHDLFMGGIEFINFLYDGKDLSNQKIIPIFDYMMDYYNGLLSEEIIEVIDNFAENVEKFNMEGLI